MKCASFIDEWLPEQEYKTTLYFDEAKNELKLEDEYTAYTILWRLSSLPKFIAALQTLIEPVPKDLSKSTGSTGSTDLVGKKVTVLMEDDTFMDGKVTRVLEAVDGSNTQVMVVLNSKSHHNPIRFPSGRVYFLKEPT